VSALRRGDTCVFLCAFGGIYVLISWFCKRVLGAYELEIVVSISIGGP
jgi:hypothetical protein